MAGGVIASLFAGATATNSSFVPFPDFLQNLHSTTFADILAQNSLEFKVRDEPAFAEMRSHIFAMYHDVNVTHTFVDNQYFDCITIESQPGLRGRRIQYPSKQFVQPGVPMGRATLAVPRVQRGYEDEYGNKIRCEAGSIPMLRLSLERLLRHETLQHFLSKLPAGAPRGFTSNASRGESRHRYAHASQSVDNLGGQSNLAIYNPYGFFSLSQQWYVGYMDDGTLQTAECGNLHYPDMGWDPSAIFIYWTADGYQSQGCYNLDCEGFVQTNSDWALGGGWDKYSEVGGDQVEAAYSYGYEDGCWYLYINGDLIGYYPADIYGSDTNMAGGVAKTIDFGGEIAGADQVAWTQMGSGEWANEEWSYAAYHHNIGYYDSDGNWNDAWLTQDETDPDCYTLDGLDLDDNWGAHFYFGGPGCESIDSAMVI